MHAERCILHYLNVFMSFIGLKNYLLLCVPQGRGYLVIAIACFV